MVLEYILTIKYELLGLKEQLVADGGTLKVPQLDQILNNTTKDRPFKYEVIVVHNEVETEIYGKENNLIISHKVSKHGSEKEGIDYELTPGMFKEGKKFEKMLYDITISMDIGPGQN